MNQDTAELILLTFC